MYIVAKSELKESAHDIAFESLMKQLLHVIEQGRALDMNVILSMYQVILQQFMPGEQAMKYTYQNPNRRIEKKVMGVSLYSSL